VNEQAKVFGGPRPLREGSPPRGLFQGRNFMTPAIESYHPLRDGQSWAELSGGRGINNDPIFGVTIRPDPEYKLSAMFYSRDEAIEYIKERS